MRTEPTLPIVYVKAGEKRYDLHWDYVSIQSNYILLEKEYEFYLKGYIQGYFEALSDGKEQVSSLTSSTGTIRNLSKINAMKLKEIITSKLHTIVEKRQKEIEAYNNLPHIKLRNKHSQSSLFQ